MKSLSFILPLWIVIMAVVFFGCFIQVDKNKAPVRIGINDKTIVKQVTDSRGLASVQFFYSFWPSDTLAFDYLTPAEYKRQFNVSR